MENKKSLHWNPPDDRWIFYEMVEDSDEITNQISQKYYWIPAVADCQMNWPGFLSLLHPISVVPSAAWCKSKLHAKIRNTGSAVVLII